MSAATTIDETTDAGDERLLDLERQRLEAQAQRDRLNVEDDDPEDERLYELCWDLETEIVEAPAHTVAGVAAKIRILHENLERGRDRLTHDAAGLRTALETLERLAGTSVSVGTETKNPAISGAVPSEAAPTADPHMKWWAERQAAMAEANHLSDHTLAQEASGRVVEIDNRITNAIPLTLEGLVVQLRLIAALAVDEDVGEATLATNALTAAERLAGGES
ncbi:MAG: hypothetical protein V3T13_06865 [Hyphomicrobium sp.]